MMIQEGEQIHVELVPGFSVLNAEDPLRLPDGFDNVVAVMCGRTSILPITRDFRVVTDLMMPFNITSAGRAIVLEISNGQLRVRSIAGALTPDEITSIQAVMNEAQLILQNDAPSTNRDSK